MKDISKKGCEEIIAKAYHFLPKESHNEHFDKDISKLPLSVFNELALYIEETIGANVSGRSIQNLLQGAGPKNSTINILCAFLLLKEDRLNIQNEELNKHLATDNRYFARRYFDDNTSVLKGETNTSSENTKKAPMPKWAIVLLAILPLLLLAVIYKSLKIINYPTLDVELVESEVFPKDISVTYDLVDSKNVSNSFIKFEGEEIKLSQLKGDTVLTVRFPNQYALELFTSGSLTAKKQVLIKSDGWVGYLDRFKKLDPSDYNNNQEFHFQRPELLKKPEQEYYTHYNNFKVFDSKGDDFVLEADIKNPRVDLRQWAFDIGIDVIGTENSVIFNLLSQDALKYAVLQVGDTRFDKDNNAKKIENLGIVVENYRRLKVQCKNSRIQIFLDQYKLIDEAYSGSNGEIVGLQFFFKGAGFVKNITLDGKEV